MTRLFWLEQTDADLPAGDDWLSCDEASRLAGMRFSKRRGDFRLGRWTGKRAVSLYWNLAASRIDIRAARSGAPLVFVDGEQAAVSISLSHRDGTAACAIAPARVEVGCDLELIEPREKCFLSDYFTVEEQNRIAAAGEDQAAVETLFWSAKESALKLLGTGLRLDTRAITVSHESDGGHAAEWQPLRCRVDLPGAAARTLNGCWRKAGSLVRTVLASPCARRDIEEML